MEGDSQVTPFINSPLIGIYFKYLQESKYTFNKDHTPNELFLYNSTNPIEKVIIKRLKKKKKKISFNIILK